MTAEGCGYYKPAPTVYPKPTAFKKTAISTSISKTSSLPTVTPSKLSTYAASTTIYTSKGTLYTSKATSGPVYTSTSATSKGPCITTDYTKKTYVSASTTPNTSNSGKSINLSSTSTASKTTPVYTSTGKINIQNGSTTPVNTSSSAAPRKSNIIVDKIKNTYAFASTTPNTSSPSKKAIDNSKIERAIDDSNKGTSNPKKVDRVEKGVGNIFSGGALVTIGVVVAAAGVTVLTGGVGTPFLVAALAAGTTVAGGTTALMGLSDITEGSQDVYHGTTGNKSVSINPIRDSVFCGNKDAYSSAEMLSASFATFGYAALSNLAKTPVNKGTGNAEINNELIIDSANEIKNTGGETAVGHALQKHAGRNPDIWGKVSGNSQKINETANNILNEILDAPGNFQKVTTNGITFLEKTLPDGHGVRLNLDGTFKGFIDQ